MNKNRKPDKQKTKTNGKMEKGGSKKTPADPDRASSKSQQLFLKGRELAAKDERFSAVVSNPIYRSVPKAEKKVDIDSRFKSMFHDDKFKLKYKVDKRGRPVNTTTDENLKKYYNLVDDVGNEKSSSDDDEVKSEVDSDSENEDQDQVKSEDDDQDQDELEGDVKESEIRIKTKTNLTDEVKKKLRSSHVDYARGEADFISEESSDDDSSDAGGDEEEVDHDWGELDKDSERTEDSTRRLALCNMDWDRLKAVDLMVLFTSFLPAGGVLQSVSIYVSEYGKQRMEEEELRGPIELAQFKQEVTSDHEDPQDVGSEDEEEGSSFHREKLRQYQLNRLKYFYAVLEFDSVGTAEKVYDECDGLEYESSAAKIDLRFIPDEMKFDEVAKDKCQSRPDSSKYRPKFFTTTALQQVKVDCTWDETDPTRKEIIGRVLDKNEKIDDEDLKAYLASSSSESEDDEDKCEPSNDKVNDSSDPDPIAKYRALLESIETSEKKKKNDDVQLEITWGVGLKQKAEELVKKKTEENEIEKLTPWEAHLTKQKEKKKQRKAEKRKLKDSDSDSEDNSKSDSGRDSDAFSDDDVDVDMDDPFFRDEIAARQKSSDAGQKKKKVNAKKEKSADGNKEKNSTGELDLLLMDEDDGKKHFNFKKLIEEENVSKSKKKRKFKKAKKLEGDSKPAETSDDFQVNAEDNRFAKLYTSHHYNIDPSEPNFKKTKGMEKIIQKKQEARAHSLQENEPASNSDQSNSKLANEKDKDLENTNSDKIRQTAELSCLVKSIKKNTQNVQIAKNAKGKGNFKNTKLKK